MVRHSEPSLPSRLTDEFEDCLDAIAAGPSSHAHHPRIPAPAVRVVSFRSFPYIVLYRLDATETLVLAVVHVRRGDDALSEAATRS
ncbi:type II toxin-antitoxin system RelE/ParE family toxin [Alienimonas sp. DA493]|uniref:type II toxin-antitoxin system RelE/ParE family toxin n=1 Tax=Alienimonas sp. DA493 TaxID=3373605 RepID=UPI00375409D9